MLLNRNIAAASQIAPSCGEKMSATYLSSLLPMVTPTPTSHQPTPAQEGGQVISSCSIVAMTLTQLKSDVEQTQVSHNLLVLATMLTTQLQAQITQRGVKYHPGGFIPLCLRIPRCQWNRIAWRHSRPGLRRSGRGLKSWLALGCTILVSGFTSGVILVCSLVAVYCGLRN